MSVPPGSLHRSEMDRSEMPEPSTPPHVMQRHTAVASCIRLLKRQTNLLRDVASVYGVQLANYVFPLLTVPYLTRVLGPAAWGLIAMAQAFAMYGHLIVEYGFIYSATRELAGNTDRVQIERVIAGVTGARVLLSAGVLLLAYAGCCWVPLFHQHPLLLWAAVISEILKAALPNYYFYGMQQVSLASTLDISARTASLLGVFFLVRKPEDAWIFFGLQGAGAALALGISHWMIFSRYSMRAPRVEDGIRMLKDGAAMFLFRSSHNLYVLGNAFILGLFAPPQDVGYYAGAEKVNSAAVGLLSPLSTALYPRAASMAKTEMKKAARLTTLSVYAMVAISVVLTLVMWLGAPLIVRILLGTHYQPSTGVMEVLSLRAPLMACTNVLGFQWLLALGLERPFQKVTMAALGMNVLLATCLAPRFSFMGMAWAVVFSQGLAVLGIYLVLRRRRLNPFVISSGAVYA